MADRTVAEVGTASGVVGSAAQPKLDMVVAGGAHLDRDSLAGSIRLVVAVDVTCWSSAVGVERKLCGP